MSEKIKAMEAKLDGAPLPAKVEATPDVVSPGLNQSILPLDAACDQRQFDPLGMLGQQAQLSKPPYVWSQQTKEQFTTYLRDSRTFDELYGKMKTYDAAITEEILWAFMYNEADKKETFNKLKAVLR